MSNSTNTSHLGRLCEFTFPQDSPTTGDVITFTVLYVLECGFSLIFILYLAIKMLLRQNLSESWRRDSQENQKCLNGPFVLWYKLRSFSRPQTYVFNKLIGDGIFIITWGLMVLLSFVLPVNKQEPTIAAIDLLNSTALAHSVVNHVFITCQHYRITVKPIEARSQPGFSQLFRRTCGPMTDVIVLWTISIVIGLLYELQYYNFQFHSGPYGNFIWVGIMSVLLFVLPLLTIITVSVAMARHRRNEWQPNVTGNRSETSLPSISTSTCSSIEIHQRFETQRRNATARLYRLTWLFLLCWAPYHVATFALPSPYVIQCLQNPSEKVFIIWKSTTIVAYMYFALYPLALNFENSFTCRLRLEWLKFKLKDNPRIIRIRSISSRIF